MSKSNEEKLKYMRIIGKKVGIVLKKIKFEIKEGSSGNDLNFIAKKIMDEQEIFSSCKDYKGFPSYICVSVNENLTHGIPNDNKFSIGDLVSVDISCFLKNNNGNTYHADAAFTKIIFPKNKEDKFLSETILENEKLLNVTFGSLIHVISKIIPGFTTNKNIGEFIEDYVKINSGEKFFTIKEYGGHGIGNVLHDFPFIPNYGNYSGKEVIIKSGMFICIEPLVQKNDDLISIKNDGWTVFSKNKFLNAHFEHTLYINNDGAEILTNYDE